MRSLQTDWRAMRRSRSGGASLSPMDAMLILYWENENYQKPFYVFPSMRPTSMKCPNSSSISAFTVATSAKPAAGRSPVWQPKQYCSKNALPSCAKPEIALHLRWG